MKTLKTALSVSSSALILAFTFVARAESCFSVSQFNAQASKMPAALQSLPITLSGVYSVMGISKAVQLRVARNGTVRVTLNSNPYQTNTISEFCPSGNHVTLKMTDGTTYSATSSGASVSVTNSDGQTLSMQPGSGRAVAKNSATSFDSGSDGNQ